MRIVFMGTPDFSVPCLMALADAGNEIAGVYTQPDKPRGRGYTMMPPPVKEEAQKRGMPVFQPTTLRDEGVIAELRALEPEMIVVVAYGKILPQEIIDMPEFGCVNIHASLLPEYRGAAPIQQAILDGKKVTGVTAQLMDAGIDTGDILMSSETPIEENETADELHDRLSQMGAELIVRVVDAARNGTLTRLKQDDSRATHVGKLTKEMSAIDFTQSAETVHNKVRGLNSWPGATAMLRGKRIKIHRTVIAKGEGRPGSVLSLSPLVVACGEGAVEIRELQPEGKKRMDPGAFLNGLRVSDPGELEFS